MRQAWQDAARAQEGAVEGARGLDRERLQRRLAAQKEMLGRLDAELARRAAALAAAASPDSWPRGVQTQLDEARRRIAAGVAASAALPLRDAAVRLRGAAAGGRSGPYRSAAAAFDSAADALQGAPGEPPAEPERARPAADAQALARRSAERLRAELEQVTRSLGFLSGRIARRVDEALGEEDAAERSLRRGAVSEGLARAEAALALLEEGGSDADSAASAAASAAAAMSVSVAGRGTLRAAPGGTGSGLGRVRLPSAQDYRPPRELREELERSLMETRPAGADADVKEYLKRLAR